MLGTLFVDSDKFYKKTEDRAGRSGIGGVLRECAWY